MASPRCTDLLAALRDVPVPRHRRGQRHAWPLPLTLIAAALVSGERNPRAVGQWVSEHTDELVAILELPRRRLPSVATLRRALRAADLAALKGCLVGPAAEAPPAEESAGAP